EVSRSVNWRTFSLHAIPSSARSCRHPSQKLIVVEQSPSGGDPPAIPSEVLIRRRTAFGTVIKSGWTSQWLDCAELQLASRLPNRWRGSGRRDSNPRRPAWESPFRLKTQDQAVHSDQLSINEISNFPHSSFKPPLNGVEK